MPRRLTAVGIHGFAGGFSLGVSEHFEVLGQLESSSYGAASVEHNLNVPVWYPDHNWPLQDLIGVDLIYGNPPCAPFSACNGKSKSYWRDDDRVNCIWQAHAMLPTLRPKAWVIESVRGLYQKAIDLVKELAQDAARQGYATTIVLTDGPEHGVPHRRPRCYLVLSKYELIWRPTGVARCPTVAEALADVEPDGSQDEANQSELERLKKKGLLKETPPGTKVRDTFNRLYPDAAPVKKKRGWVVEGRPSFQIKRMDPDGITPAMTSDPQQLHWAEDRWLAVNERARLCGFPSWWEMQGPSARSKYQQLAQGVFPPTAAYIAKTIKNGIRRARPVNEVTALREVTVYGTKTEERVYHDFIQSPTDFLF